MEQGDAYAGALGRFYRFYIERPRVAAVVGRAVWGSDFGPLYRSLDELREVPEGATVLDVACGAGLALRWLDPDRGLRYVGVDSSPAMLARARATARQLRFSDVELHRADVECMPVTDEAADVCLLYNSLHCFADPSAALDEAVRCLRPGGTMVGSMLVRGAVPRVDRLIDGDLARGGSTMGPGGTGDDLRCWLAARLTDVEVTGHGALAVFSARRVGATVADGGHGDG